MSRAVSFQRPHFHLAKALAAELRLAAQWLLRHQAVRAGRAGVHFVFHQVRQLHHVDDAHRHRLIERPSRLAVVKGHLAHGRQRLEQFTAHLLCALADLFIPQVAGLDAALFQPQLQTGGDRLAVARASVGDVFSNIVSSV